jgi:hypothetical protein
MKLVTLTKNVLLAAFFASSIVLASQPEGFQSGEQLSDHDTENISAQLDFLEIELQKIFDGLFEMGEAGNTSLIKKVEEILSALQKQDLLKDGVHAVQKKRAFKDQLKTVNGLFSTVAETIRSIALGSDVQTRETLEALLKQCASLLGHQSIDTLNDEAFAQKLQSALNLESAPPVQSAPNKERAELSLTKRFKQLKLEVPSTSLGRDLRPDDSHSFPIYDGNVRESLGDPTGVSQKKDRTMAAAQRLANACTSGSVVDVQEALNYGKIVCYDILEFINTPDHQGLTPLHRAGLVRNKDIVSILLKNGATKEGLSRPALEFINSVCQAQELSVESAADTRLAQRSFDERFIEALKRQDLNSVSQLFFDQTESLDINISREVCEGYTFFQYAVRWSSLEVVEFFIQVCSANLLILGPDVLSVYDLAFFAKDARVAKYFAALAKKLIQS